jgi:DNA-binding CsgD family transcriptional regulator
MLPALSPDVTRIVASLPPREREMLVCILSGLSSKAAARTLKIGGDTARKYSASLRQRFSVDTTTALITRVASDVAFHAAQWANRPRT